MIDEKEQRFNMSNGMYTSRTSRTNSGLDQIHQPHSQHDVWSNILEWELLTCSTNMGVTEEFLKGVIVKPFNIRDFTELANLAVSYNLAEMWRLLHIGTSTILNYGWNGFFKIL